jgi:hypothetical protein
MAPAKLLVNCSFSWSHLSIECLSSDSSHVSGAWAEGEVEALGVVVAARILDGEGVAPERLNGILLRVVLGDPQRFELVREEQVAKPRREGGEAVVVARGGGLYPPQLFNLLAGVVAAL